MSEVYEPAFVERLRRHVSDLCPRWGLSSSTRIGVLCLSENATFLATDPCRTAPLVIRVHRPGYHDAREIHSELAWIEALRADRVVSTPEPLRTTDGQRIASVEAAGRTLHAVAFAFMSGREPGPEEPLGPCFRALGAMAARLHAHARRWSPPSGFRRATWNLESIVGDVPRWGRWQDAPGLDRADRALLERAVSLLRSRIEAYGRAPSRFGLVHADLRLANLLVDGDRLGVVDFDDCGFGWFMHDFAASASFVEERPDMPSLLAAWCAGYRTVSPLEAEDEAMVPLFVMLRRLQLTAWLASRGGTATAGEFGPGYPAGTVRLACRLLESGSPLEA